MKPQKTVKTFKVKLVHKSEDLQFLWNASKEYGEYYNKQIDVLSNHFELMKQDKELKMIDKFDFEKMFAMKRLKYEPKYIRQSHVLTSVWSIYNSLTSFFALLKSKGITNCQPPMKHKSDKRFNAMFFMKIDSDLGRSTLIIKDKQTLILRYIDRNIEFKCLYNKKFDISKLDLSTDGHNLVWSIKDKCFYFHFCVNVKKLITIKTNKSLFIDLGQKTLITGYIPELNEILEVSSKPLTNKRLTDRIDQTQSKRDNSKLSKYSKKWRFINRAKRRLETKRTNQKKTYLHKISRKLVNEFDTIIVGKLSKNQIDQSMKQSIVSSGALLTTKVITTKKIIRSKQANRRRNQDWPLALFVDMLSYKASFSGKRFEEIDESYTTQECCVCKNRQHMKLGDRTYHCKCGLELPRDVNSSVNIYDKYMGGSSPYRNINFLNGVKHTKLFV